MAFWLLIPVFFPIAMGLAMLVINHKERKSRQAYVLSVVIINMIASIIIMFTLPHKAFTLIKFSDSVSITLRIDGLSTIFGMIVSILWVIATFYSLEYMKHEGKENRFFAFFTMSFGVVLGIAYSSNLITMYLFYELLTVATTPLVMHQMNKKAASAGKRYITYSIGGASFGFISIMILLFTVGNVEFTYGGVLKDLVFTNANHQLLLIGYLLAFFGFGIKAAIFPFFRWLPSAGVAPTPVSALLHAVAVVNAGIFAISRLTYYSFGADFLRYSWVQYVAMTATIITIVFGSSMALREKHIKRRLAYSTVSNLSYMLFSLTTMNEMGLVGSLAHMTFHSIIKITLFFVAGAIIYKTGKEYVDEIAGYGKAMPITLATFTICSLGLIGIPPLMGITSKWLIGNAAVISGQPLAWVGTIALIVSALLTAIYLFDMIIVAYFPRKDADFNIEKVKDPNAYMTAPMIILTAASVFFGIYPKPLIMAFELVAKGLF